MDADEGFKRKRKYVWFGKMNNCEMGRSDGC
jgi:hypothetical protein